MCHQSQRFAAAAQQFRQVVLGLLGFARSSQIAEQDRNIALAGAEQLFAPLVGKGLHDLRGRKNCPGLPVPFQLRTFANGAGHLGNEL